MSSLKSTPSTTEEPGQAPRAPLPGELYRRADRWWWRVKLPGEDKAKARPLKLDGAKADADVRETAERIAFEMWERAVEENVARQVKIDSTEKIERLKAQFLDKVRHFAELVETANAKMEAEAKARVEAEEKLKQWSAVQIVTPDPDPGPQLPVGDRPAANNQRLPTCNGHPAQDNAGQKTEDVGEPAPPIAAQVLEAQRAASPSSNPQSCQPRLSSGGPITSPPVPTAGPSPVSPGVDQRPPVETGACECCGATGIAMTHLNRIDSGQSLCPRCLAALRADVARVEAGTFAKGAGRGNK
jgi:hypothetical protein